MSIFKNDEEREYVVAKLTESNRPEDLGNFFMFYDELTSEDIFEFHYMARHKFFVEMFKHIFGFLLSELKSGNYMKYAGNIFQNIYVDNFYKFKTVKKDDYKDRDAILCVFLREILLYLNNNDYRAELSFTLSTIADNENINKDVLKEILKSDISFNNHFIVEDLLDTYILSMKDIMDIIENRFEFTTNDDVLELFRKLYTSEDNLIGILNVVLSKYEFRENRRGEIKVVPRAKGKTKRFYELIREFLTEVIISEAEVDMWDYINGAENMYVNSRDLYYIDLFNKVKSYLGSDDRKQYMVRLFNKHNQEEFKNLLSYDEIVAINNEVNTTRFIYQLDWLEPYKFFIRIFNINRFGFLSYDRAVPEIRKAIKERSYDISSEILYSAIDKKVYNLLLNY